MSIKFIAITVLVFLAIAASVNATGCCLNANVIACRSTELTELECCPDNPLFYGPDGAPDQGTCREHYFLDGVNCGVAVKCARGCCCSSSSSEWSTAPECQQGVFTDYLDMTSDCTASFCSQFGIIGPGTELPTSLQCGSGVAKPWLTLDAIKGEKSVALRFGSTCEIIPTHFKIARRSYDSPIFRTLVEEYTGFDYTDADPMLNWSNQYEYRVTAVYQLKSGREGSNRTRRFTLGNLLCWKKYDDTPFCVGDQFFTLQSPTTPPFIPYFRQNLNVPDSNMDSFISTNFVEYEFNGYNCTEDNSLQEVKNCAESDKACVYTGSGTQCYVKDECRGVDPFGLFTGGYPACESTIPLPGEAKYCFFDSSATLVGKCYDCEAEMSCYDYKSEETCKRNPCYANGPRECIWNYTNVELGVGVCKAIGQDNCRFCTTSGTQGVDSSEAHNYIFNSCTQEKLNALEVPGYPCGSIENTECRDLICEAVNKDEGVCADVIDLNWDNTINSGSDICDGSIKVCKSTAQQKCFKDANGDGIADCLPTNVSCQRDRYPPRTELNSYGILTPEDDLIFDIFDKKENSGVEKQYSIGEGYTVYMCADLEDRTCGQQGYDGRNGAYPYQVMTSNVMSVYDLIVSGVLDFSVNKIRWFAVDPSSNVEEVKEQKVNVTVNAIGGLGIFVGPPLNGSYINYTRNVKFHVFARAYKDDIYEMILYSSTGEPVAEFYSGGGTRNIDETRLLQLQPVDGEKRYVLYIKYGDTQERRSNYVIYLDRANPMVPVIYPIPSVLNQNYLKFSGCGEPRSIITIEGDFNNGGSYEELKTVTVPDSNEECQNFSTIIYLREGDWKFKAIAHDLAENPSGYTPVYETSFATSAPSFDVVPPHGSVRASVSNVTVYYKLVSYRFPLDPDLSNLTLLKSGEKVDGILRWIDPITLRFIPDNTLINGTYSVIVRSQDISDNPPLKKISSFEISAVPRITVNWTRNSFKTKHRTIPVSGSVWGRGVDIDDAWYTVEGDRFELRVLGGFPQYFDFSRVPELEDSEGFQSVIFYAKNNIGGVAVEPFEIVLDRLAPIAPTIGLI